MKLIGSLTSPFVRKVRVVLAEKQIESAFDIDSPWVAGNNVGKSNPLNKVPVLLLDDGLPVYDSRVIAEYLDAMTPNNRLIPATGRERMLVKRWEALADGICDAAAATFLEQKRPAMQQSPEWIARQREKIDQGVTVMAEELGERAWCHGNSLSLADIAAGCALGYLAFRFPDIDWPIRYPGLNTLYQKLMARASFAESVPQG